METVFISLALAGIGLVVFWALIETLRDSPFDGVRFPMAFAVAALGVLGIFSQSSEGLIVNAILLLYAALALCLFALVVTVWFANHWRCLRRWKRHRSTGDRLTRPEAGDSLDREGQKGSRHRPLRRWVESVQSHRRGE